MDKSRFRRHAFTQKHRRAFTLIELLVVLSIVGVLMSLILPAVLRATESARRAECASRLGQLAKGAISFESTYQSLPISSFTKWTPALPGLKSPWVPLLPFVDQGAAYREIDFEEDGAGAYPAPPSSSRNAKFLKLDIAAFRCPSDHGLPGGANYRMCLGIGARGLQPRHWRGASYALYGKVNAKVPLSAVEDGLSQTVLYSEKIMGDGSPDEFTAASDVFLVSPYPAQIDPDSFALYCKNKWPGQAPHFSFGGSTWFFSGYPYTWYNHVLTPNTRMPDCAANDVMLSVSVATARSWHGGGVNAVFADGACRFMSEAVDLRVWRAIGTRAGHEPVTF